MMDKKIFYMCFAIVILVGIIYYFDDPNIPGFIGDVNNYYSVELDDDTRLLKIISLGFVITLVTSLFLASFFEVWKDHSHLKQEASLE